MKKIIAFCALFYAMGAIGDVPHIVPAPGCPVGTLCCPVALFCDETGCGDTGAFRIQFGSGSPLAGMHEYDLGGIQAFAPHMPPEIYAFGCLYDGIGGQAWAWSNPGKIVGDWTPPMKQNPGVTCKSLNPADCQIIPQS